MLQPPACNSISRRRRDTVNDDTVKGVEGLDGGTPATIEVYSGLYVNEASDVASKSDFTDDVFRERVRRCCILSCFPKRKSNYDSMLVRSKKIQFYILLSKILS